MNLRYKLLVMTAALASVAMAQEGYVPEVRIEARAVYQHDSDDKDNSGFRGQYLNLVVNGTIGSHVTYCYRQRLNRTSLSASFFDATDMLYIAYTPTRLLTLSMGKNALDIGGYEYDAAPIDVYYASEFWHNFSCYQWGAAACLNLGKGTDRLKLQVTQSPFRSLYKQANMFAYNLVWSGRHGVFHPLWSVNMLEWAPGEFISYVALGTELALGRVRLQLDLMNRADIRHRLWQDDWSVVGRVTYTPIDALDLSVKCNHDTNRSGLASDIAVVDSTDMTRVSMDIEYFPLRHARDIRIHTSVAYSFGTYGGGVMRDRQLLVNVGVTWKMNLLHPFANIKRHASHEKE